MKLSIKTSDLNRIQESLICVFVQMEEINYRWVVSVYLSCIVRGITEKIPLQHKTVWTLCFAGLMAGWTRGRQTDNNGKETKWFLCPFVTPNILELLLMNTFWRKNVKNCPKNEKRKYVTELICAFMLMRVHGACRYRCRHCELVRDPMSITVSDWTWSSFTPSSTHTHGI